jgi:tetratricopeptide (TPR) repeat protein
MGAEAFWQGMAGIADRDGDQRITRGEFVTGAVKRLRDNPDRFAEIARPFLHAALDVADSDGDGRATVEATARVLGCLGASEDVAARAAAALDTDADGRIGEADHRRWLAELERQVARAPQLTRVVDPTPRVPAAGWTRRRLSIAVATAAAVGVSALLISAVEPRTPAATATTAGAADAGAAAARPGAAGADAQGLSEVEAAVEQVKAHPQEASAHVELARAYTGVEQPQLAAVEYLAATQIDPGNAEANTALALLAFKAGNAQQADALASKALARRPAYPEALYTRGMIRAMGLHHPAAATRDLRAYQVAAPGGSHRTTVATVLALLESKAIR